MKLLLIISAVVEALPGALLMVVPALPVSFLLGVPLDAPVGSVAARLAGAALFSLAIACWTARNGERGGPASGVVAAMLFYNFAAVAVLAYAGVALEMRGPLLWPTIVLHLGLMVWCLVILWFDQRRSAGAANS